VTRSIAVSADDPQRSKRVVGGSSFAVPSMLVDLCYASQLHCSWRGAL